ncbi:unnamed protein product [Calypogeia fissa]
MHGAKRLTHSPDRQASSWSDSDQPELPDECCNQLQHLEMRSGVDLLNSWSEDCSSKATAKQFGDEKTNQLGPTTPTVLRSAAKPPRARRAAVVPLSTKQVTFRTPASTDSHEGSRKLAPRKKLQKLSRFRVRDFDVSKMLGSQNNLTTED